MLRHGQTAWNRERRVQGHLDVPLDEAGRSQAAQVAPVLAAMEPVSVWTSDLSRASETAETVAGAAGLLVQTDPRLREFDMGELSGTTMDQFEARNPDEAALLATGDYTVVPGGENVRQLTDRVVPALEDAFAALAPGQLGIVVTHGGAARFGSCAWLGLSPRTASLLRALGNCHWAVLEESVPAAGPARGPRGDRRRLGAYNCHA